MKFDKSKFEKARKSHFGLFKHKVDNKLRGAYGITDFNKKEIRISKKAHKSNHIKRITPNKNGTENMLTTIVHEEMHAKHPKASEKVVESKARRLVKKMSNKEKQKRYKRYN